MLSLLWLLIIGLLAGLLARLVVPGKESMSLLATSSSGWPALSSADCCWGW